MLGACRRGSLSLRGKGDLTADCLLSVADCATLCCVWFRVFDAVVKFEMFCLFVCALWVRRRVGGSRVVT